MTEQMPNAQFYEDAIRKAVPDLGPMEASSWEATVVAGDPWARTIGFMNRGEPYKSGPRKGERRWLKPEHKYVVTTAQAREMEQAWLAAGGKCTNCLDTREVFARWNHLTGTTMKPCPKCS